MSKIVSCRMCSERGKTWSGSDPKCAFSEGFFQPDNWNCATANALRDRCGGDWGESESDAIAFAYRDDMSAGSFGAFYVPETEEMSGFYVVMSWYKRRGKTGWIYFMRDDERPRTLRIEEAEAAIKAVRSPE